MKKLFILLTILILNILFLSAFSCKVDPVYFQLTISAENGSVIVEDDGQTLSGYSPYEIEEGSTVILTANPDKHWLFDGWSGDASGSDNSVSISMDDDKTVTANFVEITSITLTLEGSLTTAGGPQDVVYRDGYLYIADFVNGIVIADVSDPSNPIVVGSEMTTDLAFGVDLSGNYAYIADNNNGVPIIDISDPTDPQEVSRFDNDLANNLIYRG